MTRLLELASEVEILGAPDAKLDAEIWCAAFAPPDAYVQQSRFNFAWCIYHGVSIRSGEPRIWEAKNSRVQNVTGSLDSALLLLPRGSMWSACYMEDGPFAQVIRPMPCGGYINGLTTGRGVTPPLSLCAAALRALAGDAAIPVNACATSQSETGE